ncbi:uncharacterized protein C11orf53 homolog isoform X1 [Hypomesus transpacificus]|uniref:uncharacterized protein C11orf53 homolog isoform X1 n=2 Tax=Hypomesus transpacificus TaxID=137520 RepID=UPI001F077ECF|nr:uncharacterized protein C11orf53 homolog isoform X1 [Hypomesus transpacificus]
MEADYSKRVYQGVRVKHTVKDLLAEKRSRQPNGPRYSGAAVSPTSFVQMPGSHIMPGYYGMRRPYISESDFCPSSKQFSSDMYSSSLGVKPLGCDPSGMSGYPPLMDSYYPETFGDYRSAAAFSGGGTIFPSSALSSLLPPFSGDFSHFLLRDSWEQTAAEPVPQGEGLCAEGLSSVSVPTSLPSPDPQGSPSQYRSPHRGSLLGPPAQPYSLHALEDSHYHHTSYPAPSAYPCSPYITAPSDMASKMPSEDQDSTMAPHGDTSSWCKEDSSSPWSPYELRRSY